jgi:PAS domain S-box-containing protein
MPALNDLTSQHTASSRFQRLRLGVVVLGVLVILAFAASSAYDGWRAYGNALSATEREIVNESNTLAEQTAWTFQAVDLLVEDTARWYRTDGVRMAPEHIDEVLANRVSGVRQVSLLTVTDARGIQRYRSNGPPPPDFDVSDRSYFIAQRDSAVPGVYMSEALISRSEHRAAIVLSRRLEDDKKTFLGVVTALVNLEDLQQIYRAVNLGQGSGIDLLRDSGTLLVRIPGAPEVLGHDYPQLAANAGAPMGRIVSPIDGRHDFIAVAQVRGTPLLLVVTREQAVALHGWRDQAMRLGLRTLLVVLLGVLTIAALLRQLRRVELGEQALRASEERYALAMEGANEGHWDWDIASDRLFLSPKMRAWAGLSADSLVNTRTAWLQQIVIHPDDGSRFDAALRDHFEGRTPRYECEYRIRQRDGQWRWLLSRGRCLRRTTGEPYRFVGSTTDVTVEKQTQTDKENLEAQLRQSQKMEAIGTLAGGIAHDFNNILGAILGYCELAHQHSAEGSALRRYLDNIQHAAGRAKSLVDRILGFSRSGLGERVPVHVQAITEETLELLAASLPAGIRLEQNLLAGNAAVIGDATQLHQVVMNLCTNALHAMEHGGVLGVVPKRIELSEPRTLSRGTLAAGPHLQLTVSDTGSGIPPAVFERMFDPFFTTKGVGEGTGLGLSVVHGIVTDLGGAIGVSTRAECGTTFEIWLPIGGETVDSSAEEARELPRGNGAVVMIVDDEPALVALAEEMLAELGYEPVGFNSSTSALRAFRDDPKRFDLILTDEAMPDLVGTEFARQIRQQAPAIPIVLMSGYGGPQLAQRAAAIGINEVLRKPLQSRDLAESLARVQQPVNNPKAL